MDKVYIFGHKYPDTDSITSAIALEYLKKSIGVYAEARCLGELNDETTYILDRFNIKHPKYLNDVKLQIRNVLYHKDIYINEKASILDVYDYMNEHSVTGVPVVDDKKVFRDIVTAKTLLSNSINCDLDELYTSYDNIIHTIDGEEVLRVDHEIKGLVNAVSYRSTTVLENFDFSSNDILIVGDRHSIIEKAVNSKVKLIILTGNSDIKEEHLEIARKNNVNIIRTKYNTFRTSRRIMLSNYIKTLFTGNRAYTIYEGDYYDDVIEKTKELGYNNYPVVDKKGVVLGLFRVTDIVHKNKKKVILVDHNESSQSAGGLDEAEILEVIDHHKIGDISTNNPINFRNMTVGSCNTIIYNMYAEARITIPKDIAAIMLGGIISDTLALSSPTTTDMDIEVVKKLEEISGLNYKEYAADIFNSSIKLNEKSEKELLHLDIKSFHYGNGRVFRVSQVVCMNGNDILSRKDKIIEELNNMRNDKDLDFVLFLITDISRNGSYILYSDTTQSYNTLSRAFDKEVYEGMFLNGMLSRKKQVIPLLMEVE